MFITKDHLDTLLKLQAEMIVRSINNDIQSIHKTVDNLFGEIRELKAILQMAMGISNASPYPPQPNPPNHLEKLRTIQAAMDAQVGSVTEGTVDLPRELKERG